jgi:hypothetical protein
MSKPKRHSMVRAAALLCALAPSAFANTYVVDDDGGPGVDFTNIPAAIAAASPGDVLLVRPGTYSSFTLTKGLSILGESGVSVGRFTVDGLPRGQVAVIARCDVLPSIFRTYIGSCVGTVIVQNVTGGSYSVVDSRDVRFFNVSPRAFVQVPLTPPPPSNGAALLACRSRIEAVQSTMLGADYGNDDKFTIAGGAGVYAAGPGLEAGSLVHLALTSCTGGRGSSSSDGGPVGTGGAGVLVANDFGGEVVIAGGDAATIRGGLGGDIFSGCHSSSSFGGPALAVHDPLVRYSAVVLTPGAGCWRAGPQIVTDDPSFVLEPGYADPTLGVSGSTSPGGLLQFHIRAHPRSKAHLNYGRTPIVQSESSSQIGVLVDVVRGLKLGAIPVSGEIDRAFPIPSNATVGSLFVFQAVVILPNGEMRRTNSVPVIVR